MLLSTERNKNMKGLVITLFSGENEIEACKKSVVNQTFDCTHQIITGLPNVEAHKEIYKRFSNAEKDFQIYCKLDADMIFNDNRVMDDVSQYFIDNVSVDHVVLPVNDFFTNSNIIGIHFFRRGVYWEDNHDHYFVDHSPIINGKRRFLNWKDRVTHCSNPSEKQAYLFGVHRATKFIEAIKARKIIHIVSQFDTLIKLERNYNNNKNNIYLMAAIAGALESFSGEIGHYEYTDKSNFKLKSRIVYLKGDVDLRKNIFIRLLSLPNWLIVKFFLVYIKKSIGEVLR